MSDLRECVVGDTTVWLTDGRHVRIAELVGSQPMVFAMAPDGQIVPSEAERIWSHGIRPVSRVKLQSGRSLTVTEVHRLYTENGRMPLARIRVGDRLRALGTTADLEETSELFWDPIECIDPTGEAEVFDLTVPGPESWFSNGVVSHNSCGIEQDADLILLIYREDQYDRDTVRKGSPTSLLPSSATGPARISS